MSGEAAIRANRAALLAAKEQGASEPVGEVVIGRDVLELVSSAMYIDPMTVYREYVQNAADAIDDARQLGLLTASEDGKVTIDIDPSTRSIRIRDNGTGVPAKDFARRMAALGASNKRGSSSRGFRGVGRLAGLGYAQELVFRSRAVGDELVSELTWDCRKLKSLLRQTDGSIEDLVREVATYRRKPAGGYPEHFFEVELRGVIRIRSDKLMNPAAVDDYLGQVAPVPFSPDFSFGEEIRSVLEPVVRLGELKIYVDGKSDPIYRPHRNSLVQENGKPITFDSISINEISGMDGGPAAVVWVLHHEYEGALTNGSGVKGLRLRAGNVQVGENNLLEDLFPEARFNSWSVGEIHVIDRKIVPNGRRDHFEQNAHYANLINQLSPIAREISKLCRTNSIKRKWLREAELQQEQIEHAIQVFDQGAIGNVEREKLVARTEENFGRATKAINNSLFEASETEEITQSLEGLREKFESAKGSSAVQLPVPELDETERRAFTRFCDLVYECSSNSGAAKILIDKILARLQN